MNCERPPEIVGIGTVESVDTREPTDTVVGDVSSFPSTVQSTISTTEMVTSTTFSTTTVTVSSSTEENRTIPPASSSTFIPTTRPTAARTGNVVIMRTTPSPPKQLHDQMQQHQPRPPLVLGSPLYKSKSSEKDIVVKDVLRQDNAVIIYWDTEANNILGFRVIYRLFGDNSFKQAPPLEASEREFKIKNVPSQVAALEQKLDTLTTTQKELYNTRIAVEFSNYGIDRYSVVIDYPFILYVYTYILGSKTCYQKICYISNENCYLPWQDEPY